MTDQTNWLRTFFEWASIAVILAAAFVSTLDTNIPALIHAKWGPTNGWIDDIAYGTVILFGIEYVVRFATAPSKREYAFSFFGIIDLIAVLVGLAALPQFAFLRLLRVLQIVRLLKLARYSSALATLAKSFGSMRNEIIMFLNVTGLLILMAAFGVYHFEHEAQPEEFSHLGDALWWAVATLTTVGYGDIYPITIGGKIMTAIVVLCGLGIVAAPAGIVATAMATALREKNEEGAESAAGNESQPTISTE